MKFASLLLVGLLLAGCATALKQEGRCLASLTPGYLKAQEELEQLETSWRASMLRRDAALNGPSADRRQETVRDAGDAYRRFVDAKASYRPMLDWYDRVYKRVRTRMDEEEILTEVGAVLITNPGVIFYPVIRWNIHTVFWDGADPDADTDPVTKYCSDRLAQVASAAAPPSAQAN